MIIVSIESDKEFKYYLTRSIRILHGTVGFCKIIHGFQYKEFGPCTAKVAKCIQELKNVLK